MELTFEIAKRTDKFIKKYLNCDIKIPAREENPDVIIRNWNEIYGELFEASENLIDLYIKTEYSYENYHKFGNTLYWKFTSDNVKLRDNFQCQLDISHSIINGLVAHHNDYDNTHGREIQNLRNLITLCKPCHDKHHDKDRGKTYKIDSTQIINVKSIDLQRKIDNVVQYNRYMEELNGLALPIPTMEDKSIGNTIISHKQFSLDCERIIHQLNKINF